MPISYDNKDPKSIESHAKLLLNKTLREVYGEYKVGTGRGALGQAVEKHHFNYNPNSTSEPDFPVAGLELKVSPLKKLKNGDLVAKERLVLNIINYMEEHNKEWANSSFWKKNKRLLIMFYIHEDETPIFDLLFELIKIWDYPKEDLIIIKNDWEVIQDKIKKGKAHQISEGDTMYLGACTKGVGHGGDMRRQPFSNELAKQRAFSLKKKYLDVIVDIWMGRRELYDVEPIIKDVRELSKEESFEKFIEKKFKPYYGKTPLEIQAALGINGINPAAKNYFATLTMRILGVQTKKAEEFEKADITIKTIRLKTNGVPKEDISFPYFKYKEIIEEEWENSTFKEMLEKKFFLVVYKYDKKGRLALHKVAFWNMPAQDIESFAKIVWERTVSQIRNNDASNLPKKSENYACHVRPHGRNSKDTDQTPNGVWLVKKCFWLNGGYIRDQIEKSTSD